MMQRRFYGAHMKGAREAIVKTGIISAKRANGVTAKNPRQTSPKRLKNPANCRRNQTAV